MKEIELKINGKRFNFFNAFEITLKYNSVGSTFSFEGSYDPSIEAQKSLFKPLSYNLVQLYYNGELFLTGRLLNTSTSISGTSTLANISGYALPGVLEDCQIPIDVYPLQFNGLNLKQITEKLIQPFGIELVIDSVVQSEVTKIYEKISSEPGSTIKQFIAMLAGQRNVVLTHNTSGSLVLTRANVSNRSIATYDENIPSTNVGLTVNGQQIHSKITIMKQATIGTDVAGEDTVSNSLIDIYRPTVKIQSSGDNDDTKDYAEKERGSELRGIQLTIETDRWQWYDGKKLRLIQPNNIIDVISPNNFINNRTRFFVEACNFTGSTDINTVVLKCVLPECYTGIQPKNIFG